MGAGNPKLSSFDSDKFEPTTYFLDLSQDFDTTKEYLTTEFGEEPSDDMVYQEIDQLSEFAWEDLIETITSEFKLTEHKLDRGNSYAELSYAFRNEGIILAEGEKVFVISESSAEYSHLPIGVIPNFKFETFLDDAAFEMEDRREWYQARGKNLDAAIEKLAEKRWEKEMKEFHKEAETILNGLHKMYPTTMSGRNGAWMSYQIPQSIALVA